MGVVLLESFVPVIWVLGILNLLYFWNNVYFNFFSVSETELNQAKSDYALITETAQDVKERCVSLPGKFSFDNVPIFLALLIPFF